MQKAMSFNNAAIVYIKGGADRVFGIWAKMMKFT